MTKHFIKKLIRALLCLWCFLIVFIPNVDALEVDSCFDDYKLDLGNGNFIIVTNPDLSHTYVYNNSSNSFERDSSSTTGTFISYNHLFPFERNKTYYISSSLNTSITGRNRFLGLTFYDSDKNVSYLLWRLDNYSLDYCNLDYQNNIYSFNIPDDFLPDKDLSYVQFSIYGYFYNNLYTNNNLYFTDFNLKDSSCPSTEPDNPPVVEPAEPDKPSITESDENKLVSDFFELFIDRIKYLTQFAVSSPIFLTFISIFILVIILEFILYLFNKGGYK